MGAGILVTGSSGHAGRAIVQALNDDYEVVGLDVVAGEYTKVVGSITDLSLLTKVLEGVDVVFHTASLHAPHVPTHSREDFVDVNIKGTLNLLEAAAKNGVSKFIYTSTTSLYGEQFENKDQAVWITEEVQPMPRDIYDITKIAAEQLCKDFYQNGGMRTLVLRVSRFWDEPWPDKVFYRMYRGVDVRDIVQAHRLAMEAVLDTFQVFNISAKTPFQLGDLSSLRRNIPAVLKRRKPELLDFYQKRGWPIKPYIDRVYVIEKAERMLGYNPQFNIDELLQELEQEE